MSSVDISKLNPEQRKAAIHKDGPLLILAGAGSGKTATTIHRISYLIGEHDVKPYNILAVTFTNKAAQEMRNRAIKLVGDEAKDVTMATFHSFCARFLRKEIHNSNIYNNKFSIFDDTDSKNIIKEVLKELKLDDKKNSANSLLSWISSLKSELIECGDMKKIMTWLMNPLSSLPELPPYVDIDKASAIIRSIPQMNWGTLGYVYEKYQKKLIKNNALDFDDLIFVTVKILANNPKVLLKYQERYKYIMVDEYQDTNHSQYILIKLLAAKYKNIAVVGDDFQCIYSFRNADMRNILSFEKDYPNAKVIKLEQNYRSTESILDIANQVISFNKNQRKKHLWTDRGVGEPVVYRICENVEEEAEYIAERIKEYSHKYAMSDFTVLYRVNAQSRAIEDYLMRYGLPYDIVGGFSFYQRKEIKDIGAYLKVLMNPENDLDLIRIVNSPKRGIGNSTIEKASAYASENSISLWESLEAAENYMSGASLKKVKSFIELMNGLKNEMSMYQVGELVEVILDDSGYRKALEDENTEESRDRLENLKEFLNIAWDYQSQEDASLEGFIERISLVQNDVSKSEDIPKINLMTIHAAKGLEFPVVFMIGMEENVLPYWRALEDTSGVEEERRLCYVAVTRAKEKLFMTRVIARRIYGKTEVNEPSRFLVEMGFEEEHKPMFPW